MAKSGYLAKQEQQKQAAAYTFDGRLRKRNGDDCLSFNPAKETK